MSETQRFKVGDNVPAEWFVLSEPAKVTFGADCSFEIGADGKRYGKAELGVWPYVMLFEPEREGSNLKVTFYPELVILNWSSGADMFRSVKGEPEKD